MNLGWTQGQSPYLSFVVALLISSLLAYPIWRLLLLLRARQNVSEFIPEHAAKQGTPTMGGVIALAGIVPALTFVYSPTAQSSQLLGMAAWLVIGLGIVGFLDDYVAPRFLNRKRGLAWKEKLVLQLIAVSSATGPIAFGVLSQSLTPDNPYLIYETDHYVHWAASIVVIVFFVNAYNFADGLDGLAGGLGLVLAPTFGAMASIFWQSPVPFAVGLSVTAAIIPLLFLNSPPARLFMGDTGSMAIGGIIGLLAVVALRMDIPEFKGHVWSGPFMDPMWRARPPEFPTTLLPVAIAAIVMLTELVPVPLQIASVKLAKKRLFPKTPIHHAFEAAGWPETRITSLFILVQIAASGTAIWLATWMYSGYER